MSENQATPTAPAATTLPAEPKPKHEGKTMSGGQIRSLVPTNIAEAEHIAQILAGSDLVPKEMIRKPANVLLAIMYGMEIGISPAQALQNVMVVNGRPCLWGDAVMGKVLGSGLCDDWTDTYDPKTMTATFAVKRKGKQEPIIRTFSWDDAKRAKLDSKQTYQQYGPRMLFHRARSWALRDGFPDVLKGIRYYEEERDVIEMKEVLGSKGAIYEPKSLAETAKSPQAAQAGCPKSPQEAAQGGPETAGTAQGSPMTPEPAQASPGKAQEETIRAIPLSVVKVKGGDFRVQAKTPEGTVIMETPSAVIAREIKDEVKDGRPLDFRVVPMMGDGLEVLGFRRVIPG